MSTRYGEQNCYIMLYHGTNMRYRYRLVSTVFALFWYNVSTIRESLMHPKSSALPTGLHPDIKLLFLVRSHTHIANLLSQRLQSFGVTLVNLYDRNMVGMTGLEPAASCSQLLTDSFLSVALGFSPIFIGWLIPTQLSIDFHPRLTLGTTSVASQLY